MLKATHTSIDLHLLNGLTNSYPKISDSLISYHNMIVRETNVTTKYKVETKTKKQNKKQKHWNNEKERKESVPKQKT